MKPIALAAFLLLAIPFQAGAQSSDSGILGVGRLFSNDYLGDGRDRWRTGSFALSVLRGPIWEGTPPTQPGRLLEARVRAEIIAPSRLSGDGPDDRPYAGSLSFGLHSHWSALGGEVSAGADVVVVGPQTGIGEFQERFHEEFGGPVSTVLDRQLGDDAHISVALAYAAPLRLSERVTLRPFAEATAGVEDIVRFGGDVILGGAAHDALWIRDLPSGQLYQGVEGSTTGISLVGGVDYARVGDSLWLPGDGAAEAEDGRFRTRAGVHWQIAPRTSFFYGVAYLSPEFEGQEVGQTTGQLKLNFNF